MWYRYSLDNLNNPSTPESVDKPTDSLHIFDIDDTLFHTNAQIDVVDPMGNVVESLTNQEFNNHTLPEGYKYNFDQFTDANKFATESNPINNMLSKVRRIYQNVQAKNAREGTNSKVILSTARSDFDNKETIIKFFREHGIPIDEGIYLHRAGNVPGNAPPAEKKNFVLESQYLQPGHNIRYISFYDDSKKNLEAFLTLKKQYPGVQFRAFHVKPDGSTKVWNQKAIERELQQSQI
jgi:hypothetical protein